MDATDRAIVDQLQRDARQSNRDLAAKLNIAPSTCLERVRALRARGVITGYHAAVDLRALNRNLQALIAVQVRPLSRDVITDFKRYMSEQPEVLSVFVLAGGDDFIVHVAVADIQRLHDFLMDRFTIRREIVGFRTSIVYQHVDSTVVTPLVP
ncbi:Lrp/AsnC family transcriptional regulator [Virgisporangium ochraceum]|uniref:AsnC family transcriptional regulator n=1 Tax=Virgisporangium ochraceum TaxID=65505 RepID=A0A8J4E8Q2_9ACTN|nr:Lrp/AsnC family transcriptional regulator [Virgisporangium ochraceum]GIJ65473.1 AsnC family transcriptional regulator [Virgisporangium ochraceum]